MSQPPFTMSKYATKEDLLKDKCAWLEQQLAEAQVRIKVLEDACISAESAFVTQVGGDYTDVCHDAVLKIRKALSTSPTPELDKLLADEREKCAKVCETISYETADDIAEAIRRIEP